MSPQEKVVTRRSLRMMACRKQNLKKAPHPLHLPMELLISLVSEWMDVHSISKLDIAICSKDYRPIWRQTLSELSENTSLERWQHSHASLRWIIRRKISVRTISLPSFSSIRESTFRGIDMKTLKYFHVADEDTFEHCKYKVIDVSFYYLAHGCPNLQLIHMSRYITLSNYVVQALRQHCMKLDYHFIPTMSDTRPSWHMPSDMLARRSIGIILYKILELRRTNNSAAEDERIQKVAMRVENALYHRASSREEYSDLDSLKVRLKQLAEDLTAKKSFALNLIE